MGAGVLAEGYLEKPFLSLSLFLHHDHTHTTTILKCPHNFFIKLHLKPVTHFLGVC